MSSRSLRPTGRKIGVAALAASLGLAGLGLAAVPAQALPGFAFERLAGEDRIETAVAISTDTFASSTTALIARADKFPDALAGNYLAGAQQDPILLSHTDDVPDETLAELDRLGVTAVTLLGGTDALSAAAEAELEAAGYTVDRQAGVDRYETAADIATSQDPATIGNTADGRTAILATGEKFPDALAGGPLAYAGSHPLLLTPTAALGDDASGALETLGIEHVLILGGSAAVSDTVEAELTAMGMTSERLAGDFRWETATAIAEYALANAGFSAEHVNVATGLKFPDALTGGPHAGEDLAPILLADDSNTSFAVAYLEAHADTLVDGHIYGGTLAVSQAVEDTLEAAAQGDGPTTNQTLAVTPAEAATNEFSAASPNDNRGRRSYSLSGLDDTKTYDIFLFPAEFVTNTDGTVTFRDTEGTTVTTDDNNVADWAATAADIELVNNTAATDTNGSVLDVAPVNGVIQFAIDSTSVDQVIPVVFQDADNGSTDGAPDLDLAASNAPSEPFGIGGQKNFIAPVAAASANADDGRVVSLDEAANRFSIDTAFTDAGDYDADAADVSYIYDGNDTFSVEGVPATLEEFESQLSRGDGVSVGAYSPTPGAVSVFNIFDDSPDAPTSVTATAGTTGASTDDITVVTDPAEIENPALYDSFVIQRKAATAPDTSYATVKTLTPAEDADTSATTITWVDMNVAPGSYIYRVAGVIDGDQGAFTPSGTATSTTPGPDTAAPLAIDSVVTSNSGLANTFDTGDVFKVVFNEPMGAPATGDTIRAQDGDGTVGDFVNGTNAAFTLNAVSETVNGASRPAGTVLTVTLTGAPTVVTAGTAAGLQIPATITDQAGTADAAGNNWNVSAGGQDVVLDQDAVDNQNNSGDTTGPTATSNDVVAGNTAQTITFSEAINPATLTCADITTNSTETCTGIVMNTANTVATVTYSDALEATDVLTLAANSVTDVAGNTGPPTALNETV